MPTLGSVPINWTMAVMQPGSRSRSVLSCTTMSPVAAANALFTATE